MIKAIILDDEQASINILTSFLEVYDDLNIVGAFRSMKEAEEAIVNIQPDLLFLDIRIKGQYVFTLLESLKKRQLDFAIIFVTGFYKEHLDDAIDTCGFKYPFSYIGKPVDPALLEEHMERFHLYHMKNSSAKVDRDSLVIKSTNGFKRLRFTDVVYCESDGNYTNIFTINNDRLKRSNIQLSLKLLASQMPDNQFFRMSSKHLINTSFFEEVLTKGKRRDCILRHPQLAEDISLPIPENKWSRFKEHLF